VLIELGVMQQRHEAVLEVMGGLSVTEVATRYGVTRQTVHRWLRRYARYGLAGLAGESTRPGSCPHQMRPEVEARIVELRLLHPAWGPRTIAHYLAREEISPVPGRSSIHRCLVRHRLIDPQKRRRKREDYRRWERERAMELWQMDVMGGVRLTDGRELKLVSGIDDHSRYCVSARLVWRATARPVCEALLTALGRYGAPEQILTDNGKVFTGRFGPGTGQVLFDRICREHDVRHLLTAPRSPTTTGKVERFHRTLRTEFLAGRTFASLEEAQAELDAWVESYNAERPHQSLGMATPAARFALAARREAAEEPDAAVHAATDADLRAVTRRVGHSGKISLAGELYHVGTYLAGETVGLELTDGGLLQVSHHGVLVASPARRRPPANGGAERPPRVRRARSQDATASVIRLVDTTGYVSFAGTGYWLGVHHRGQQVEVRRVGDSVEIRHAGVLLRTQPARHDRAKEHGAFSTPNGRPHRKNSARHCDATGGTDVVEPKWNTGGGT
jgi:transposase InsO family protein